VLGRFVRWRLSRLPRVRLNPELVFLCFLPPLLLSGCSLHFVAGFSRQSSPDSAAGRRLVLFYHSRSRFSGAITLFAELPLAAGFVLGAIVSPPDAIAAMAIARPPPLALIGIVSILEGESLVNDATALVALRFAIVAVSSNSFSLAHAAGSPIHSWLPWAESPSGWGWDMSPLRFKSELMMRRLKSRFPC